MRRRAGRPASIQRRMRRLVLTVGVSIVAVAGAVQLNSLQSEMRVRLYTELVLLAVVTAALLAFLMR